MVRAVAPAAPAVASTTSSLQTKILPPASPSRAEPQMSGMGTACQIWASTIRSSSACTVRCTQSRHAAPNAPLQPGLLRVDAPPLAGF